MRPSPTAFSQEFGTTVCVHEMHQKDEKIKQQKEQLQQKDTTSRLILKYMRENSFASSLDALHRRDG